MIKNLKPIGALLIAFAIISLFLLTFMKMDNDEKSVMLCEQFEKNQLDMATCPAHNSNFSWLIILSYGIGFVMLVIGVYLLFIPRFNPAEEEPKHDIKDIDKSKLDEEENKCYEVIKNKGGSAYQTDLITETGFSKVKITRVLDKLESKGILERKRRGMTNIIVLK